ncbi:MAG: hypothetical protein UX87_C0049G0001, partial [Candidatus Amesbacteria bacterium GW2011_GWA1_47_16]
CRTGNHLLYNCPMKQLALINPENVSEQEANDYFVREAVRAVVLDENNHVALLYVAKEKYYKLPGGGIEAGEDKAAALRRECQEEIGSEIKVVGELGYIVEYRKFSSLKQTSYCYLTQLKSKTGSTQFTDEEKHNRFKSVWLPIPEALRVLSAITAIGIEGRDYISPRDTAFLKAANIV